MICDNTCVHRGLCKLHWMHDSNTDCVYYQPDQSKTIEKFETALFKAEDITQMIAKEKQEYFDKLQIAEDKIEKLNKIIIKTAVESYEKFAEKLKKECNTIPQCHFSLLTIEHTIDRILKDLKSKII